MYTAVVDAVHGGTKRVIINNGHARVLVDIVVNINIVVDVCRRFCG